MITRLGLLDIATSASCSIMVWSKVETEGEAYIKTLGQQVLGKCCQLCFMPRVCCFSRLFLVNFLLCCHRNFSFWSQSPTTHLSVHLHCQTATLNSLLYVELQSVMPPDCLCDSKCGLYSDYPSNYTTENTVWNTNIIFLYYALVERTRAKYCCSTGPFNHRW